jgi:hypothetical protein
MKKLTILALAMALSTAVWAGSEYDASPYPGGSGTFAPGDVIWSMCACPPLPDTDGQCLGVEYVKGQFYVTSGNSNTDPNIVYVYDSLGTYLRSWNQPSGSTGWGGRDLCWDGNKLYHGHGTAATIYMCDTLGNYLARTITGPSTPARALAFDPATKHLWTASFTSSIWEFDTTGAVLHTYSNSYNVYGMAWDTLSAGGPWLWTFGQDGTPAQTIHQFNPRTGVYTGVDYVVPSAGSGIAGGACFTGDWHPLGKFGLFVLSQTAPWDSVLAVELGDYSGVESPTPVSRQGRLALAVSPNPSRSGAMVEFALPTRGEVSLKVYDAQGRLVRTLVSGIREAGTFHVSLGSLSAGVYFCSLQTGAYKTARSLVVIR